MELPLEILYYYLYADCNNRRCNNMKTGYARKVQASYSPEFKKNEKITASFDATNR